MAQKVKEPRKELKKIVKMVITYEDGDGNRMDVSVCPGRSKITREAVGFIAKHSGGREAMRKALAKKPVKQG